MALKHGVKVENVQTFTSCLVLLNRSRWYYSENNDFFFFLENFNLWRPLLMVTLYHQIKTPISFWCRRRLNPKFLIQPSETLPVELIETHDNNEN